jgi:hypothetical protein
MMMQAQIRPPRAGFSGEMDPDLSDAGRGWLRGRPPQPGALRSRPRSVDFSSPRRGASRTNRGRGLVYSLVNRPRAYPVLVDSHALDRVVSGAPGQSAAW